MEDLGFVKRDKERNLYIPVNKMSCTIDVDRLCLSLDGSNGQRGGRTEAVFYYPSLPKNGKATGKISLTTTMITGSTTSREAIPYHFQFWINSQIAETEIGGGFGCLHASCP